MYRLFCVQDRKNVILIGDSLGDPKMTGGLPHLDCVIKIGFLNAKVRLQNEVT